jgi:hypothetical protein
VCLLKCPSSISEKEKKIGINYVTYTWAVKIKTRRWMFVKGRRKEHEYKLKGLRM